MALRLEDYAIVGDRQTAALVGKDGSIDWLCFPCFDSDACFAALLGGPEHGRWILGPALPARGVTRAYRGETLVLDTEFRCGASRSSGGKRRRALSSSGCSRFATTSGCSLKNTILPRAGSWATSHRRSPTWRW